MKREASKFLARNISFPPTNEWDQVFGPKFASIEFDQTGY